MANKLEEWFKAGLKDWDISRDGPYFGFKIPGEEDKYFYVWLDAPIGYMASTKNYCDRHGLNFDELWNSPANELYHFIGKDIMYFHALFWPAMLIGAGFKTANKLFVHGFLTVNGEKMSKSRGTFIRASTYAEHLDPEFLRYYYASKLTDTVDDIDLAIEDFIGKTNADLVGKYANLASRSGPMLTRQLGGRLGTLDAEGRQLVEKLVTAKDQIVRDYEGLNYATVVRTIGALADEANRYVEQKQPWSDDQDRPRADADHADGRPERREGADDLSQAHPAEVRAEGREVSERGRSELRGCGTHAGKSCKSVRLSDYSRELTRSR